MLGGQKSLDILHTVGIYIQFLVSKSFSYIYYYYYYYYHHHHIIINSRDFSLFRVCPGIEDCPARCASASNVVCMDCDILKTQNDSPDHTSL
jgi:hypothetical protein